MVVETRKQSAEKRNGERKEKQPNDQQVTKKTPEKLRKNNSTWMRIGDLYNGFSQRNLWCFIVGLSALIIMAYLSLKYSSSEVDTLDLKIDELVGKYQNLPDDIWSTLTFCLKSTLKGKQPCIILMLNGGEENFSKLLNDIGDLSVDLVKESLNDMVASKYLLKGSTITTSEENYSFEHYKSKLKENKVLLIDQLEMVPGKIMENFHSLCDVYDAAVKQAVIVFLLNYKDIPADLNDELNDATIAINILSDLWKDSIHHDLINPLAIRVAENVVHLQTKS